MGRPLVKNRTVALVGGILLVVAGMWLLYDAYEARGIDKPFAMRFLPGF